MKNPLIMNDKKLKIIVIAGGGIYGIIPCYFLKTLGEQGVNNIDIFGGTSVGGIISLHLANYLNPIKLYDDFKSNVSKFFTKEFINIFNPFTSKYSEKGIENSLKSIFTSKVCECQKNFVVPSFSLKSIEPVIFHNFDKSFDHMKLWKIARATSAAPIFFPPFSENILIDGGILENLPIITTASIVCKYFNKKPSDLDIFAIGTGKKDKNLTRTKQEVSKYTKLDWAKNLLPIIITGGNEMMSELWGKNMGFNYFKLFNPVIINGVMDNINDLSIVQEKCQLYKGCFLQQWQKFISF